MHKVYENRTLVAVDLSGDWNVVERNCANRMRLQIAMVKNAAPHGKGVGVLRDTGEKLGGRGSLIDVLFA